ncbi:MAG: ABC transporter substrate-binding protein [Thermosynechococcaceae cyanobacterium]
MTALKPSPRRMKTPVILSTVLVLTASTLMGCGTGPSKDGAGKVIHYLRSSEYKSLDPPKQFDVVSAELIGSLYDPLLTYHYLKRPYELTPNLAEKMPELADDKITYTFTLRKGVKFHDDPCFPEGKGRELTVDDVLFSIKRFSDANINTRSYAVLLEGRIKGLDQFRAKTREQKDIDYTKEEVEGLKKIDAQTFQVILTEPDPLALMAFANEALVIMPPEAIAKYGQKMDHHAVGTGPFTLAQNNRRGEIVLKKNPNYHGTYPSEGNPGDKEAGLLERAGKQLPFVDEIRLPLIEESQPAMLKFRKGEIDWIGIDRDNFKTMAKKEGDTFSLQGEFAEKFEIYSTPSLSSGYITINFQDQLFGKNKALRQAIAHAIDVQEIIDKMSNGRGIALDTIVPLPIAGSQESIPVKWYPHDLQKAKAKLAEAGFPNGTGLGSITMEYGSADSQTRQSYNFLRAQLQKANIELKPNFQTFPNYLKKLEAANFQIAIGGWQADLPDPENFYQLLYSKNKAPGPNNGSYNNPEYDKLYEQMRRMPPGPERNAVIEKLATIVKEDIPVLLLSNGTVVGMHQKWLLNFKRNLMISSQYKFLDIEPAAKTKGLPR